MNVNLGQTNLFDSADNGTFDVDTIQESIEEHQEILSGSGIPICGPAVLVPEGHDYPGSYQVWNPVYRADDHCDNCDACADTLWAYVDTEGVVQYREELPRPHEMKSR